MNREERLKRLADSIVRLEGKSPCKAEGCKSAGTYGCLECGNFFCYGHIFMYNGLHYCEGCLPQYNRDQQ
jgi:Tc5 transposase C-terminal domain